MQASSLPSGRRVLRSKKLDPGDGERSLVEEFRARYSFIREQERDAGLRLMRAEAKANAVGWIDPRPTSFIIASKPGPRPRPPAPAE